MIFFSCIYDWEILGTLVNICIKLHIFIFKENACCFYEDLFSVLAFYLQLLSWNARGNIRAYFYSCSVLLLFNSFRYPIVILTFLLLIMLSFKKYWKNLMLSHSLSVKHIFIPSTMIFPSMLSPFQFFHYILFILYIFPYLNKLGFGVKYL